MKGETNISIAVALALVIGMSCTSPATPPATTHVNSVVPDPQALCSRISEIKRIPFKDEKIDDAAYNALLNAGEKVIPCLIDRVTDTTPMRDPRSIPGPPSTQVGDVALFVLIDIAKLDFDALLPPEVQKRLKTEGVYAYHEYVGEGENRRRLQATLREWYREKYGNQ